MAREREVEVAERKATPEGEGANHLLSYANCRIDRRSRKHVVTTVENE